jgi:hypothetical protein
MDSVLVVVIPALLAVCAVIGAAALLKRGDDEPATLVRTKAAGSTWGTGDVTDRRALWGRRYGGGSAWTAGAIGLSTTSGRDGVGDPLAECGGSA